MLKKTITYDDCDGNSRTEDFYFNISKAELVELEVSEKDGFAETLERIVQAKDGKAIIANMKKIILMAYGEKTPDGRGFTKSPELQAAFAGTEAYSQLFVELATDAGAAAAFINGVVPKGLAQAVEEAKAVRDVPLPPTDVQSNGAKETGENSPVAESASTGETPKPKDNRPAWLREDREPTDSELMNMPKEELLMAMKIKNKKALEKSNDVA